jgi:hypothetical protein
MAMMPVWTGWLTFLRVMIPGGGLLHRIGGVGLDRPFAVERLAERVHHAPEQALAHRHLQQLAGATDLVALLELRVVPQDDHADLGLVEVEREAGDAVAQVDHLVEHRVGQALDAGHAVADLPDHADALLGGVRLRARDLGFDFLQQVAHQDLSGSVPAARRAPSECFRRRRRCRP